MENNVKNWSVKGSLAHGWNITKTNFWFLAALLLIIYIVSYALEESAVGFLFSAFTGFIMASVALRLSRHEHTDFKNLFKDLSGGKFVQYLIMMIITTIFIIVGAVLLVVPGIVVAIMTAFSTYVLLDKPKNVAWNSTSFWQSIKESKHITKGHKWDLFGYFLLALVLNILGALAFGVGLIVTIPVTLIGLAHIYDKLKKVEIHTGEAPVSNTEVVEPSEIV